MCRYVVECVGFSCGHHYSFRRQWVNCNNSRCGLSPSHSPDEHDHRQCATQANPDLRLVMPGCLYRYPCNACLGAPTVPGNGANGVYANAGSRDAFEHNNDDDDKSGSESISSDYDAKCRDRKRG